MRYETIFQEGNYALIVRGADLTEYAVVYGLDNIAKEWGHTCSYFDFGKYGRLSQPQALSLALDAFFYKTKEDYVSRSRLAEVATRFKDALLEADCDSAMECFEECDLSEYEQQFFGISDFFIETGDSEDFDETDFDDSAMWEDDSHLNCKDCPDDECTGHCMSCGYRPY